MIWIKLQVGTARGWLALQADTEAAHQQIKGLELAAQLFTSVDVRVLETRFSKHPTELAFSHEDIKQLIKEQQHDNEIT